MAEKEGIPPVTVRIGGEDHTIRANVAPEYTRKCAQWVDDRITEIRDQLGLIESHKAAILAALSITDEMFQARGQVEEVREATARRAEALRMRLEEATAESSPGPGNGEKPE
jgi:cell division protein ZapA